jgi:hypothetical protein
VQEPFAFKIRLYCEASALRVLLTEKQNNPRFEGLVAEFEKFIFPSVPTFDRIAKLEAVKLAMKNLNQLIFDKEEFSWARTWFTGIGREETNPATLALLVQLLAKDTKLLRELIREIGPPAR